jgi:hypothetical protein
MNMKISNHSQPEDLCKSAMARAWGSTLFERGAASHDHHDAPLLDNVTSFPKKIGFVTRLELGFRAMYGAATGNLGNQLSKDATTLRMTDRDMAAQVSQVARFYLFDASNEAIAHKTALIEKVQECLQNGSGAGATSKENYDGQPSERLDPAEQAAILQLVKAAINADNLPKAAYQARCSKVLSAIDDPQFQKVRADAGFRWTGAMSRIATSIAAKATVVAVAPGIEFFTNCFGFGAAEAAVHQAVDARVRSSSATWTKRAMSKGLNSHIAALFKTSDTTDSLFNYATNSRRDFLKIKAHLENRTGVTPDLAQAANVLSTYAKAANNFIAEADAVKDLRSNGHHLSAATYKRYHQVTQLALTMESDFRSVGLLSNTQRLASFSNYAITIDPSGHINWTTSPQNANDTADRQIVKGVQEQLNQQLNSLCSDSKKAISAEFLDIGRFSKRTFVAMVGNWFAVAAAGFDAVRHSPAFSGKQAVPVENWYMKLADYTSHHADAAFSQRTGLSHSEFGRFVSTGVSDTIAKLSGWWNGSVIGEFAKQFEFQVVQDSTGNVVGYRKLAKQLGDSSGVIHELPKGYSIVTPPNPFAEAIGNIEAIDATGDGTRLYDFDAARQGFQRALSLVTNCFFGSSIAASAAGIGLSSTTSLRAKAQQRIEKNSAGKAEQGQGQGQERYSDAQSTHDPSPRAEDISQHGNDGSKTYPTSPTPQARRKDLNIALSREEALQMYPMPDQLLENLDVSNRELVEWTNSPLTNAERVAQISVAKENYSTRIRSANFYERLFIDAWHFKKEENRLSVNDDKIWANACELANSELSTIGLPIHSQLILDYLEDFRSVLARSKGNKSFPQWRRRLASTAETALSNRLDGYCFGTMTTKPDGKS